MPDKTKKVSAPKKTVYIRLDRATYVQIDELAKKEERSFSFVAARLLEQGLRA
jgi:predicted transcriptional regulator